MSFGQILFHSYSPPLYPLNFMLSLSLSKNKQKPNKTQNTKPKVHKTLKNQSFLCVGLFLLLGMRPALECV